MAKIKKILVANRGEIAVRVMATCQELGIQSVTVYTDDDAQLPHALYSDESYCLGSGPLSDTYLNQEKILDMVKKSGADAIHPGYGFLSENAGFCEKIEKAGLIFIGPTSNSITLMGDKKESKESMEKIGVPLVPGYHGSKQDEAFLANEAKKIGFPLLIKAAAGGGGKGMRIVESAADFSHALDGAKSEALKAFSNDKVLLEKYITDPRHIEVQVLGDGKGGALHFFERECTIQRRYQKVVEETPSVALDDKLRAEICNSAVTIVKSLKYRGAGTVEFILDKDGSFYFLEMNTRLQVEHPITEKITGQDLVKWQIKVAQGEKINLKQEQIISTGHALECRIYSEDPDNNFLPTTGVIEEIGTSILKDVRLDCGYLAGNEVTINYDPMLAKLIVYADTREEAINKMLQALNDFVFSGVKTNRDYLKRIIAHPKFRSGDFYTHFVKTYEKDLESRDLKEDEVALLLAASLLAPQKRSTTSAGTVETQASSVWDEMTGFRS